MKIAITGVGGFVGNNLARHFSRSGHYVIGLFKTENLNIQQLKEISNIDLYLLDLSQPIEIDLRFDVLINAAAFSYLDKTRINLIIDSNINAVLNLADFVNRVQPSKVIHLSSNSIYGHHLGTKHFSETSPIQNPDLYGISKLFGEKIFFDTLSIDHVSLRLPAMIGHGGHRNFICESANKFLKKQPVRAFSPNSKFNNLLHIKDLADFILKLITIKKLESGPLVLCANGYLTISQTLNLLANSLDVKAQIDWIESERGHFILDASKARNTYNFNPMSVSESIIRFGQDLIKNDARITQKI